jgi:hypothetical protein
VKPLLHFPGGFVGEGNRHNAAGANPTNLDKVSYTMSNDPGFATARTSQNQHRSTNSLYGFSLGGIKLSQNVHHLIITLSALTV